MSGSDRLPPAGRGLAALSGVARPPGLAARLGTLYLLLSGGGLLLFGWLPGSHVPVADQLAAVLYTGFSALVFYRFARILVAQARAQAEDQGQGGAKARASAALTRLSRLIGTLLDGTSQGIFGMDADASITFANPAMCRLLGYAEEELVGRLPHETVHSCRPDGSDYPEEHCPVLAAVRNGVPCRGEEWYRRRDGTLLPVEYTCNPVRDGDALAGALVFFLDISERKQAEARMREAAIVFDHSGEGVLISGPDHTILAVNPALSAITGYPAEELLGRRVDLLKSEHHPAGFYRALRRGLESDGAWRGEVWLRAKTGGSSACWLNVVAVPGEAGHAGRYVSVVTDMGPIKPSRQPLHHQVHQDVLTGLPNRILLDDRLAQALKRARRGDYSVAVLIVDLDRFGDVNDRLGRAVGDGLLQAVARRIASQLRSQDTLARLGGDVFILLLDHLQEPGDAAVVAHKLGGFLHEPFHIAGHELYVSASVGISLFPQDGGDPGALIRNADAALHRAKAEGRNASCYYDAELTRVVGERLCLEKELRHALSREQLVLEFQPQIALQDGRLRGAEALLRWSHPRLGLILPGHFIPLAEETGLILSIGAWVLGEACRQARAWNDAGLPPTRVAVNVAGIQIRHPGLVDTVAQALAESGLPPPQLELEITEGFVMEGVASALEVFRGLRALGVQLAIDDFGTGYSSLSYLKRLPFDRVKIDAGFVRDLPYDPGDRAIAGAVVSLAHELDMAVTAEGVELPQQRDYLRQAGCDEVQGHLYAVSLTPQELLRRYRPVTEAAL